MPRLIVLRAIPDAAETAVTPPRPSSSASFAANSRRPRSSRKPAILRYLIRSAATSIISTRYRNQRSGISISRQTIGCAGRLERTRGLQVLEDHLHPPVTEQHGPEVSASRERTLVIIWE